MLKPSLFFFAFLGTTLAAPHTKRAISPDATCGGSSGNTCLGSTFGNCCSAYGWCGSSANHCGTGCQSSFGSCTNSQPQSSAKSSPTPTPAKASTDGSCGGSSGFTCQGSTFGNCCSQYGWCGSSADFCGTGCNSKFGTCSGSQQPSSAKPSPTPLPSTAPKVSTDASCGGTNGFTCQGSTFGNCCSSYGWCGSSADHCGTGCNAKFGSCSGGSTPSSVQPSSPASSTKPSGTAASLADCLGQRNVPVKLASDADWSAYITTYNARLPYTPATIVLPTTAQHVSDAVVCAGQFNVKVQAKSGGHSYASFNTGNGIMQINLENFQNVSVDSSGVATVGGGVRLGNMALAIFNQAGRALSHGTCPGVGIGGHASHGGYGYSSRNWGLAMDAIIGLDVVTADGKILKATSSQNADLFWALRGAADSFGIITAFYLQTQPAPSTVVNFQYTFPNMFSNVAQTVKYFQHIQDFALNATVMDKNTGLGIYMDGETFSISGQYFGAPKDFATRIAPELLRTLPSPTTKKEDQMTWINSLIALGGEGDLETPTKGYNQRDNFYAKSVTIPEANPLTTAGLTSFFNYIKSKSSSSPTSWFSIINLYGGSGSQINTKDTNFAAYRDRDSLWVFQNYGFVAPGTAFPAAGLTWINGLNNAITSQQTGTGAYLNYVDPTLSKQQVIDQYYGQTLYNRLKSLKGLVDPKNTFSNPQSIS